MKKTNLKSNLKLFLLVLLAGFTFISFVVAEDLTQQAKISSIVQESKDSTRIIVTTSGPAKFSSHWLDNPPRLVVEFQTKNVVSEIGSELLVNEGVIKRITSEYYAGGQNKTLKSLTFELLEKAPYEISQEENNIILDIHAFLTAPLGSEGKEVFVKDESKEQIVKRLEAMGAALTKVSIIHPPSEAPVAIAELPNARRRNTMSIALWFIGLALISGLGLLFFWLFWHRYRLILDKNMATQEITKLKSELQEKNKVIEQKEVIYKAVEQASRQKEREFDQLKTELQGEKQLSEFFSEFDLKRAA